MIQKILASDRYLASHDWLSTYHLFSFADYFDPKNMNFGVLRVFNDDTIDAHSGFGEHGHRDMEIITIVLEGELTHTDSMGNSGSIKSGEVQYMSAGTGVMHSEVNQGGDKVHLYQIWIMPKEKNLKPNYGQKDFSSRVEKNILVPVASGDMHDSALTIQADATIYLGELEAGKELTHHLKKGRGLFIYITEGSLVVNGTHLVVGDQARITEEETVQIVSENDAKIIALDVKV